MTVNLTATLTQSSSSAPPAFTANPEITTEPVIGQPLIADPASVSGSPTPTVAYTWYRGDPANGGTAIAGATSLEYDSPSAADLGEDLYLRAVASSSAGPDAIVDIKAATVIAEFMEDWSEYAVGDNNDPNGNNNLDDGAGGWTISGDDGNYIQLRANATSPTGKAAALIAGNNNNCRSYRKDIDALLQDHTKVDYVEYFYLYDVKDDDERMTFRRSTNSAGLAHRLGQWRHQLPGEDPDSFDGEFITGSREGNIMCILHQVEGERSRVWFWDITQPKPAVPSEVINGAGAITDIRPWVWTFFGTSEPRNEIISVSVGINTPAPIDPQLPIIPPLTDDEMSSLPSTEEGSPLDVTFNNQITFTVED